MKTAGLLITSLVDAFSILVIYLLFGTSTNGQEIDAKIGVKLPSAFHSELAGQGVRLKVEKNRYYINEKRVEKNKIADELRFLNKNTSQNKMELAPSITIIADQNQAIEDLNPILLAASEAGYSQLKMAVQHEGE
jgi:biopolymer transport protein ExbD